MSVPKLSAWEPDRQKVREWLVTAEERAAETNAAMLAAIEKMQAMTDSQLAALAAAVASAKTGVDEIANQPKGNATVYHVLKLKAEMASAVAGIQAANAAQAESIRSMLQQHVAALSSIRKAVEDRPEPKAASVEFEVTERDANNRVKKFKAVES